MQFNSLAFLAFFLVVASIHWSPLPIGVRKANLVLASYCFYASWSPLFLPLLLGTTLVDYLLAKRMSAETRPLLRKLLCGAGIACGLSLLIIFKYRALLCQTAIAIFPFHLHQPAPGSLELALLPLGISFYTFESISYLIDVYRRTCAPAGSLLDYALFISFFPHLLAGPIVRPGDLIPQFATLPRPSRDQVGWGLTLVTMGLFQKIVVADQMALIANQVFAASGRCSCADMWIGSLAFSMQIYCDFCGYSQCAIGLALLLGLALNVNFNAPYASMGFVDFWRRWHISLSSWLRDYLYIPLGGSRFGAMRTCLSLTITMALGGLWHGASWTFALWGLVHGALLVCEHVLRRSAKALFGTAMGAWWMQLPLCLATFAIIDVTWVPFRSHALQDALAELWTMSGHPSNTIQAVLRHAQQLEVATVAAAVLGLHWRLRREGCWSWWARMRWPFRSALLAAMTVLICLTPGEDIEFIYFQF